MNKYDAAQVVLRFIFDEEGTDTSRTGVLLRYWLLIGNRHRREDHRPRCPPQRGFCYFIRRKAYNMTTDRLAPPIEDRRSVDRLPGHRPVRLPALTKVKPRPGKGPTYKLRKPGTSRVLFMGPEDLLALRDQINEALESA